MQLTNKARQLSEQNKIKEAQKTYLEVLNNTNKATEQYEAALFFLYTNYQTKFAYSILLELFKNNLFRNETFNTLLEFALAPEMESMLDTYTNNVKLLSNYPYIFKKDFRPFDDLLTRFFKISDTEYIDYSLLTEKFGSITNFGNKEISHHFFQDLSKPIYAENIYSQYELEYLFDNVRESEYIAKDNHIYLYYSSFEEFQSLLQIIDFSKILKNNKFVFLFEEEKDLYPINFKERFNIDYSSFPIKKLNIKDITKLIWSVQYSSHNGGDFFDEIMDGHPYVIYSASRFMSYYEDLINKYTPAQKRKMNLTNKDIFILAVLNQNKLSLDDYSSSRIIPPVYIQPHFPRIQPKLLSNGEVIISTSNEINGMINYDFINAFKYIKTFVPLRRFTTSHAATLKFHCNTDVQDMENIPSNSIVERLKNKALYVDPSNRAFVDARTCRFEDGKLNPKATFMALSAFLDIPYTPSMEVCSCKGEINPETFKGNVRGFDSATVYRTYDEYCDDEERIILEYFYQEAMKKYGYENQYLNDVSISLEELHEIADKRSKLKETMLTKRIQFEETQCSTKEEAIIKATDYINDKYEEYQHTLHEVIDILYSNLPLVNEQGIRLKLMEPLILKKELLQQPLYK